MNELDYNAKGLDRSPTIFSVFPTKDSARGRATLTGATFSPEDMSIKYVCGIDTSTDQAKANVSSPQETALGGDSVSVGEHWLLRKTWKNLTNLMASLPAASEWKKLTVRV